MADALLESFERDIERLAKVVDSYEHMQVLGALDFDGSPVPAGAEYVYEAAQKVRKLGG